MQIEQITINQPPTKIPDFLANLHESGQRIVAGSLIWLPHPTKQGRMIAAVQVEDAPGAEADVPAKANEERITG